MFRRITDWKLKRTRLREDLPGKNIDENCERVGGVQRKFEPYVEKAYKQIHLLNKIIKDEL